VSLARPQKQSAPRVLPIRFGTPKIAKSRCIPKEMQSDRIASHTNCRFLLIEKGSYSNPASFFFFSRCSRRLLNGSGCGKS
jgi:hypothetical protein